MSLFVRLLIALVVSTSVWAVAAAEITELRFEPVDTARKRTVPIKVYLPADTTAQPIILFSHGLGGSRENSVYLGTCWAEAGFVAVFMQHHGSDELVWKNANVGSRFAELKKAAGLRSFQQRVGDVTFIIDQLERWQLDEAHALYGRLDIEHIGLSGHSFGAVTTLAVSGQRFPMNIDLEEKRIDAFLPLSPQPGKSGDPRQAFSGISKPMLCMTGTEDKSAIDPRMKPSDRQKVYAALSPGDKYQLVLDKAEHHAFGDYKTSRGRPRNKAHHPAIQQISVKFWQAYLSGDQAAKQWLQSQQPITATGLSDKDQWQFK